MTSPIMVKEKQSTELGSMRKKTDEFVDLFGISKMYATKPDGHEWFMKHNDVEELRRDRLVQNWAEREDLRKVGNTVGAKIWQASGGSNGQFRLEAWSPKKSTPEETKKARWVDVEITAYFKLVRHKDPDNTRPYAWQLYSRGGHHSGGRPCEGSALKARWWNERGANSVVKEVCHSAYTSNTAKKEGEGIVRNGYGDGRWYGSKLVIYNIRENGRTYTKQEVYTDIDATDSNGNLVIGNNWRLATSYIDRGGWFVSNSCFSSDCDGCGRRRDEILKDPGGDTRQGKENYNRNLIALRWDQETVQFAYFSGREIDRNEPINSKNFPIEEEEKRQDELPTPSPTYDPGDDEEGEVEEPGDYP